MKKRFVTQFIASTVLLAASYCTADVLHEVQLHFDGDQTTNLRFRFEVEDILKLEHCNLINLRRGNPELSNEEFWKKSSSICIPEEKAKKLASGYLSQEGATITKIEPTSYRLNHTFSPLGYKLRKEEDLIEIDRAIWFQLVEFSTLTRGINYVVVTSEGLVITAEISESVDGRPYRSLSKSEQVEQYVPPKSDRAGG